MRTRIPLNENWRFVAQIEEDSLLNLNPTMGEIIELPHTVLELPEHTFLEKSYQFLSLYSLELSVPTGDWHHAILHFAGVMNIAKVYVDKHEILVHEGGYTPFDVDLSPYVKPGQVVLLQVLVDSREIKDIPPFGGMVDYLGYGGIYREVWLDLYPRHYIKDIQIKTREALSLQKDEMSLDFAVQLEDGSLNKFSMEVRILDGQNVLFQHIYEEMNASRCCYMENHSGITRWSIEEPKLYTFEATLKQGKKVLDQASETFGYRDARFTPEGFVLNGDKIKLVGLNRHQSYPRIGYAAPRLLQEHDAEIIKYDLGCNLVRCSHYMQSDHFIRRCDEIGLLVLEEIPGWQYIGNEHFKDLSAENLRAMILHHRNHPSIVLWGTRINESPDDHDFYTRLDDLALELDDSRQTCGVRNFRLSELLEDVYTYNDFSHTGDNRGLENPRLITPLVVPYMVTEHNGHMFPVKPTDPERIRVEQAMRHMNVLDSLFEQELISGAIGWCFADYNTHQDFGSGDRVCYHGVMDMYRNPKYASATYASQKEAPYLEVLSDLQIGDQVASILSQIVVMTNCDYIKVYVNDELVGKMYSDWDQYEHVPHPPIIIEDLIGERLENNEDYPPRIARRIKRLLLSFLKHGMKLPLLDKLRMASLMAFHHMTMAEAERLYGRYIGNWGNETGVFRFEGYRDDQLVITKTRGKANQYRLVAHVEHPEIVLHDTYEITKVTATMMTEHDIPSSYANHVVQIETNDVVEVIGPNVRGMVQGIASFYVRTKKSGTATIRLSTEGLDPVETQIVIKKGA